MGDADMNENALKKLESVRDMVRTCVQCGTCTGTCPNRFAMDMTPRRMWRLVIEGEPEEVFDSKTFILCSSCYQCTLRCPRGLPLTEAMAGLKQAAAALELPRFKQSQRFYRCFMDSVKRHGRVRETEFMTYYFASMMNPMLAIKYAPLGVGLLRRGKISPFFMPGSKSNEVLAPIFDRVRELEEAS
jgi:heterodisulfide reductase subunit C